MIKLTFFWRTSDLIVVQWTDQKLWEEQMTIRLSTPILVFSSHCLHFSAFLDVLPTYCFNRGKIQMEDPPINILKRVFIF